VSSALVGKSEGVKVTDGSSSDLSASELRRALEEAGAPWRLEQDFSEDARPPAFPLGGEVPPDAPGGDEAEPIDFRTLLSGNPPADPELAQACIDAGLLDPDVALSVERHRPGREAPDQQPPSSPQAESDDVAPPVFGERGSGGEPG
jgi:hypothetical protein